MDTCSSATTALQKAATTGTTSSTSTRTTSTRTTSQVLATTKTQSTSTTTKRKGTSHPTVAPRSWEAVIYTEENCTGDYYVVEGTGDGTSTECLNFHENSTTNPNSPVSCRWYTDGGSRTGPCNTSTLKNPSSWIMHGAFCVVYAEKNCTSPTPDDSIALSGTNEPSCVNIKDTIARITRIEWASMDCNIVL